MTRSLRNRQRKGKEWREGEGRGPSFARKGGEVCSASANFICFPRIVSRVTGYFYTAMPRNCFAYRFDFGYLWMMFPQ